MNSLQELPTSALAFALGMCMGTPQRAETAGRVSLLIDELRRRGDYDTLTATLDPALQRSLTVLEAMDRGRRWNRAGRR